MIKCLKIQDARSIGSTTAITNFYKMQMRNGYNPNREVTYKNMDNTDRDRMFYNTTLQDEIEKYVVDIRNSMKACKESPEYQRIIENNYEQKDITDIPLGNIISDLKECNKELDHAESNLPKCKIIAEKNKNDKKLNVITKGMVIFLKYVIKYYSQRIKLLNNFIKAARINLKGIKNNFMTPEEFKTKISKQSLNNIDLIKFFIPKKVKYDKDIMDKINQMKHYNANGEFDNYRKLYKDIVNYAGIKDGNSFVLTVPLGDSYFIFQELKINYNVVEIGSKPLFHQANQPDLTELKPTAISNNNFMFHRAPRVYFHVSVPLNRYNARVDKDMWYGNNYYNGDAQKNNIYKAQGISKAYRDPELEKSAVFVETDNPIPVEHVDWEEYKESLARDFGIRPKERKPITKDLGVKRKTLDKDEIKKHGYSDEDADKMLDFINPNK